MIIDFKVKNFKSINSEVDFSLAASKDDAHVTNTVECEGFELLKSAAIYGANGSGKTTLINAIAFMQASFKNITRSLLPFPVITRLPSSLISL